MTRNSLMKWAVALTTLSTMVLVLFSCSSSPTKSEDQRGLSLSWARAVTGATAVEKWDFNGDGNDEIVVGLFSSELDVYGSGGVKQFTLPLNRFYWEFEIGQHAIDGYRILGYSIWHDTVSVHNQSGAYQWSFAKSDGCDGAHWGDLDGDGTAEMVVGLNGSGGLHVINDSGRVLWSDLTVGNVWNQAIVPGYSDNPGLVFATTAGGDVRMYDAQGRFRRGIDPSGGYSSSVDAARVDAAGHIQVVTNSDNYMFALDTTGATLWSFPGWDRGGSSERFWRGDLNGDGQLDWMYRQDSLTFAIRSSSDGNLLVTYKDGGSFDDCEIVNRQGSTGMLVALVGDTLKAFVYKP